MKKSDLANFDNYFERYLKYVSEEDVIESLENSLRYSKDFLLNFPKEKLEYRYQPGKWTVKEILGHLIDSERIFCYRALTLSRNNRIELPGYDQDEYIKYSNANIRNIDDLLEDLMIARKSNIILFKSFDEEMLARTGVANKKKVSVLLLGFLLSGHLLHHLNIIKERYL
jgi:hypothetical protein